MNIPIPVHPDDDGLPVSVINLRLPGGGIGTLALPLQGEKTIDNAIATLNLWKPTIVAPITPDYSI